MKSILMSIKPYYGFLIIATMKGWDLAKYGLRKKTVEVRKGVPTSPDWDKKVALYFSKDKKSLARIPEEYRDDVANLCGTVVCEFVCDEVIQAAPDYEPYFKKFFNYDFFDKNGGKLEDCLTDDEKADYANEQTLYGLHISDLKIYDKPKELSEFRKHDKSLDYASFGDIDRTYNITRPPQSWCYLENQSDLEE